MNQGTSDNFKPLLSINGETNLIERKNTQEQNDSVPQIFTDANAPVSANETRKEDPRDNNDSDQQPVTDNSVTNDDKQSKKMDRPKINESEQRHPVASDGRNSEKDPRGKNDLLRSYNDASNTDNLDYYPSYSKSLHVIWYCPFKARKPIFPTKIKYLADGTVKRILGRKPFKPHLHTLIYSHGRIHPGVQRMRHQATSPVLRLEQQKATEGTAVPLTSSNAQTIHNPTQQATRAVSNPPSLVRTTISVSGSKTSIGQVNTLIKDQQSSNNLVKPGIPVQVPQKASGGTRVHLPSLNTHATPNPAQVSTHAVSNVPSQGQTVVSVSGVQMSDHQLNTLSHQPSSNILIEPDIPISRQSQAPYQPRQGVKYFSERLDPGVQVSMIEAPRLESHFGSDGNYHYWWQYPAGHLATDIRDVARHPPWSIRPVNSITSVPRISPRLHDHQRSGRIGPIRHVEEPLLTEREDYLLRMLAAIELRLFSVENQLGVRRHIQPPNNEQPQNQDITQSESEHTDSEPVEQSTEAALHGTQSQAQHLEKRQENDRDVRSSIHDTAGPMSQAPTHTFRGAQSNQQLMNAHEHSGNIIHDHFALYFQRKLAVIEQRLTHVEQHLQDGPDMRPPNHQRHDQDRNNLQEESEPESESESIPQTATETACGTKPQPRLINNKPPNYDLQRPNNVEQQRNVLSRSSGPDLQLIYVSQRQMNCVDQFVLRRTYLRGHGLPHGGEMRIPRRRRLSFDYLLPEFAPNLNLDSVQQAPTDAVQVVRHLKRRINTDQKSDTEQPIDLECQPINVDRRNNVKQGQIYDKHQPMDVDQLPTTAGNRPVNYEYRPIYRRSVNGDHRPTYVLQMPMNVEPTMLRQPTIHIEERPLNAEQQPLNVQHERLDFPSRHIKFQPRSLNPPPGKIYAQPRILDSLPIQPKPLNFPERGIHFEPRTPYMKQLSMNFGQRPLNVGQRPMNVGQWPVNVEQRPVIVGQRPMNFEQRPIIVDIEQHPINMNVQPQFDFPIRGTAPRSLDSPPQRSYVQPQQILDSVPIQPHSLNYPPREINAQPEALNCPQRGINIEPRLPQTRHLPMNAGHRPMIVEQLKISDEQLAMIGQRAINIQQHSLNATQQPMNIQPQSFDSPRRRVHTQPQILDSISIQPRTLDSLPPEIDAQSGPVNSPAREISAETMPNMMQLPMNVGQRSINVEQRLINIDQNQLNSEQQLMNDHSQLDFPSTDINVTPRSLNSPSQMIHSQTRILASPLKKEIIQPQALDSPSWEMDAQPSPLNSPERGINTELRSLNSPLMEENIQSQLDSLPALENIQLSLLASPSFDMVQPGLIEQMEVNIQHSPLDSPDEVENVQSQPLVSPLMQDHIQPRQLDSSPTLRPIQGRQVNSPTILENMLQRRLDSSPMLENVRPWLSPRSLQNLLALHFHSPPMLNSIQPRVLDSPLMVENIQPWY